MLEADACHISFLFSKNAWGTSKKCILPKLECLNVLLNCIGFCYGKEGTTIRHIPCLNFVRDYFHYVSIVRVHSYPTFYQKCTLYPFVNHRMSKSYFCNSLHLYTWDHHDVKQPQNIRLVSPGFNTLDKVPVKTFSLWLWMIVKFVIVCLHCNSSWIPEWWYFLSPPRVCRVRNGTRLSSIYLRT